MHIQNMYSLCWTKIFGLVYIHCITVSVKKYFSRELHDTAFKKQRHIMLIIFPFQNFTLWPSTAYL